MFTLVFNIVIYTLAIIGVFSLIGASRTWWYSPTRRIDRQLRDLDKKGGRK